VYVHKHAGVKATPQKQFGMRVKELRSVQQVTQEELADRVGVFRTYMSRVETGLANPTLTFIYAIAGALKVPVAAMFDPPSQTPPAKTRSVQKASRGRVSKS
jgi:transcriptional regulator with XRE-family HTH domain